MTVPQLASIVADDFNSTIESEGFSGFTEMIRYYNWTQSDVCNEICDTINDLGSEYQYWCDEDGNIYHDFDMLCSYRDFKRLLMSKVID